MILLGLILIVLAVGAGTVLFIAAGPLTQTIDLEAYGFEVGFRPLNLLLAGAASMLLLWFGWAVLVSSSRRRSRRRREAREADRLANEERLARERAAEERLAEQQRATEAARQRAEMAERRASEPGGQGYYEAQRGDTHVQEGSYSDDRPYPEERPNPQQERPHPEQGRFYPQQERFRPQQYDDSYDPRWDPNHHNGPARY